MLSKVKEFSIFSAFFRDLKKLTISNYSIWIVSDDNQLDEIDENGLKSSTGKKI